MLRESTSVGRLGFKEGYECLHVLRVRTKLKVAGKAVKSFSVAQGTLGGGDMVGKASPGDPPGCIPICLADK